MTDNEEGLNQIFYYIIYIGGNIGKFFYIYYLYKLNNEYFDIF
jgi:hypothetical protein